MLRRVQRHSAATIALFVAGCMTSRGRPSCDPSPTPSRSTISWAPVAPNSSSEPRGRVVDTRTGAPLRDASISIDAGRFTLASDSLGEFRIPQLAPGMHQLRIRRIAYAEARDSVKAGMGGLRLLVALAPELGIVDFICIVPAR